MVSKIRRFKFLRCLSESMLLKKFLGKLKKMAGKDAVESRWYEAPLYEYTLEKEVSEVTLEGHVYEWSKGEVTVYRLTDEGWAKWTVYPPMGGEMAMKAVINSDDGFEEVDTVSGVKEIREEQIGTTEWDIKVDVANGSIVDVNRSESGNLPV